MAVEVLYDARVEVNAVVLSDHCRAVTVEYSNEALDHKVFSFDTMRRLPGLKDWSIEAEMEQDEAAGSVNATLFALIGPTVAPFNVKTRRLSSAVTATNPEYSGLAIIDGGFEPISGESGVIQSTAVRFAAAGVLTRAVA